MNTIRSRKQQLFNKIARRYKKEGPIPVETVVRHRPKYPVGHVWDTFHSAYCYRDHINDWDKELKAIARYVGVREPAWLSKQISHE